MDSDHIQRSPLNFHIDLEQDPIKSGELGSFPSRVSQPDLAVALDPPSTVVLEAGPSSGSYFSADFTTLQSLDHNKSLLILRLQCHPAVSHRFANATITWKFRPQNNAAVNPAGTPRILMHAPRKAYGAMSKVTKHLRLGLTLPIQVGQGIASAGIEPSVECETEKDVYHALTITGTSRGAPIKTYCVWTVEENKDTDSGIPSEFQLAVVLEHSGPFITDISAKAALRGGLGPVTHIRSKSTTQVLIDVENWKGKLVEWRFDDWKTYIEGITGEVEGALVDFKQMIPRP